MSVRVEPLSATHAEAYRATFAAPDARLSDGDVLPPAWEGFYFPYDAAFADLRPDGSPARDGIVPEIDLPRRMYAGETTEFFGTLRLGDEVTQTASLGTMTEKQGSSGRLAFVDVVREYAVDGQLAIRSTWHDVFLGLPDPDAPVRPPRTDPDAAAAAEWIDDLELDVRHLIRFSALTFNTHLVHVDRTWAREQENLDDLLVHGPLLRILLMDAARRHVPGRAPRLLKVQAIAPTYVDTPVRLCGATSGDTTTVTALDPADVVLAKATITWS